MQQLMGLGDVSHFGRRASHVVHQARGIVHADVRLHPEIPLVALPGLMHVRVTLALGVFGRAWRGDDRGIDDRPAAQTQSRRPSLLPTTEPKPIPPQYPSTPGSTSNGWYGYWGQVTSISQRRVTRFPWVLVEPQAMCAPGRSSALRPPWARAPPWSPRSINTRHRASPSCPSPPRKAMRPRCTHEDQIVDVTPSALGYE